MARVELDEDAARAVADGRETLGAVLRSVQSNLRRVFIVFVVGFLGTFYALRSFVWNRLKADLFSRMGPAVREQTSVVATTPFEVILLQVKLGLAVGILLSLPPAIYYSRDALRERGWWPSDHVPRWKLAVVGGLSGVLFLGGVAYGYFLFFPLMFQFLASNAVQAGFLPTYSIAKWAEFIFLLLLSFGLAAQLPLAMSALAYIEAVPYETFREKWKYAVVGIFAFGALFSPPDPFTQILWAMPLLFLYGFSLGLTKFVVTARRGSQQVDVPALARRHWNRLAGLVLVVGVVVYLALTVGVRLATRSLLPALPAPYRPGPVAVGLFGLSGPAAAAVVAGVAGLVAAALALSYLVYEAIEPGGAPTAASAGDPADLVVQELDAAGVRSAPVEVFVGMSEDDAVRHAGRALEAGDHEKAQAILDRYDTFQAAAEAGTQGPAVDPDTGEPIGDDAHAAAPDEDRGAGGAPEDDPDVVTSTAAGMVNAFTDEETTEEDIGGYYYDIAFVLESLSSKAFRIVAVFALALAGTFVFLYRGGIGAIKRDFLSRLPEAVRPEEVSVVTLHPVEALIFEIKISTVIAGIAVLPLVLYYAWPALKERGFAAGDRDVLATWAGALFLGLTAGSVAGYLYVAPGIISWLAADAVQADMIIAYRINQFGWLVFYTTAGIGLLFDIPITMVLFERGGLVPYEAMRRRWREVALAVFALTALVSPRGVFMMFILGVPIMLAYGLGLGVIWVYTLGGRRTVRRESEGESEREAAD